MFINNFIKLAWGLVAFVVISVGRSVVFWVCTNLLQLQYETSDTVAGYYALVATLGMVFAVIWRRLIRPN